MMDSDEILADPDSAPSVKEIEEFLGRRAICYWEEMSIWISDSYPGVFKPEWLFGGKKHGWYLRFKKSKSFCQFIPRRNKFLILLVFGAKERDEVEMYLDQLTPETRNEYTTAHTFHDGVWLFLAVENGKALSDVRKLLSIKRKVKGGKST